MNENGTLPHTLVMEDDPKIRRILDSIRHIVRLARLESTKFERSFGISSAQMFVLRVVGASEGLSLNEIARRTSTDQSSVSVVAHKLKERGLLEKRYADDDQRRLTITLTDAGREMLAASKMRTPQESLINSLSHFSDEERTRLADLLEATVLTAFGVGGRPAPMMFEEDSE